MICNFLGRPIQLLLAGSTGLVATLALAPAARAGDAVLWACHGPAGQPLGNGSLVDSSAGDGVTRAYGSGCGGQIGALADGGLQATFGRPDPAGGSAAGWRVAVPLGTTLASVTLDRATSGFGGSPQPGDPLIYTSSTSVGPLESTRLDDASDMPVAGRAVFPAASGGDAGFDVRCGAPAGGRCATPPGGTVGVEVSALALGVTDSSPPLGAVGGVEDPVTGPLPLYLRATDSGLGLESVTATLDGEPPVTVELGGPDCAPLTLSSTARDLPLGADCPTSVTDVPVPLGTDGVADGPHRLTVTLSDAAGNTSTLVDQTIDVVNHLVVAGSSALIAIGSGGGRPLVAGPGSGLGLGAGAPAPPRCVSPRLSAVLASRPLRVTRHRVAVLWSETRYLFTGTLTCVRKGVRVGAPIDTPIDIFSLVGKKAARRRTEAATYGRRGLFRVLLHPRTSRTIEFRYGSGRSARAVKIRVLVTPVRTPALGPDR